MSSFQLNLLLNFPIQISFHLHVYPTNNQTFPLLRLFIRMVLIITILIKLFLTRMEMNNSLNFNTKLKIKIVSLKYIKCQNKL